MFHLVGASAGQIAGKCKKISVVVNSALTGTITVQDGANVLAVITNPTVGSSFTYGRFVTGVIVNPSTTCDITVVTDGSMGGL
jgi:hypothetical protein